MAKIQSPFDIRGSAGNTTYFKNEYGQQMKEKGGPTEWQVKNLERFTNTRHNAAEWKSATAASRLVRHAMGNPLLHSVNNIRLSGRMNGRLLAAIHGDLVHDYGERMVSAGNLSALSGFEFNHKLSLEDALPFCIENCFSIEAGKLSVDIPAFRIRKKKGLPADATHYRLVSCILTIDFDKRTYHQEKCVSELHAMGRKAGAAFSIGQVVQPVNEQGCYWLMGIEFYRLEDAYPVQVRGGALRVMEWIPSEPGSIGLNGLGGSIDRVEEVPRAVVVEQPGASAVAAISSTEGVWATACDEEKKPAEAGEEEADTVYIEAMEEIFAAAYVEGAKFVEALADYAMVDEVAVVPEVDLAEVETALVVADGDRLQGLPCISGAAISGVTDSGDLRGGIEVEVDEALVNDAVEFEPSLRVLLPVEGYRRREVLKSEVLMSSAQVGSPLINNVYIE